MDEQILNKLDDLQLKRLLWEHSPKKLMDKDKPEIKREEMIEELRKVPDAEKRMHELLGNMRTQANTDSHIPSQKSQENATSKEYKLLTNEEIQKIYPYICGWLADIEKNKDEGKLNIFVAEKNLPYEFRPVEVPLQDKATFTTWQKEVIKKFNEYGNLFISAPMGAGKSWLGAYIASQIPGKVMIVVAGKDLKKQWKDYMQFMEKEYGNNQNLHYEIETYNEITNNMYRYSREEYALLIVDEGHHLAAEVWGLAAKLKSKYRIGMTATPRHSNKEKEPEIFTNIGYPILVETSLDPCVFLIISGRETPSQLFNAVANKIYEKNKTMELFPKTIIYTDAIAYAESVRKTWIRTWGIKSAVIHSQSKNDRNKIIDDFISGKISVLVTAGLLGQGVSFKDLQLIFDVDPDIGSETKHSQRAGRVAHSKLGNATAYVYFINIKKSKASKENVVKLIEDLKKDGFKKIIAPFTNGEAGRLESGTIRQEGIKKIADKILEVLSHK